MYLIQDFLRNGGTLNELHARYAIDATRHKTYPNLVLLKYNQLESPFAEKIVQEARGLILDEADNWKLICARFSKFFNFGESHAAQIDWNTARVQEKVDGSLMTMYWYDNRWHVASSGSPDASGQVGDWPFTFAELFWRVFNEMGFKVPDDTSLCPSFELCTPWNRVVVPHKDNKLVFIGLHNRLTGNELSLNTIPGYPAVKSFPLSTLDDVLAAVKGLNGSDQEGFVVFDGKDRIKIKCDDYVLKHHLRSSWSVRHAVEIVVKNEIAETIAYFPEFADQLNDLKTKYDALVNTITNDFERLKHHETQKAFALEAIKTVCSGALFALRAGKVSSVRDYLLAIQTDKLIQLMEMV